MSIYKYILYYTIFQSFILFLFFNIYLYLIYHRSNYKYVAWKVYSFLWAMYTHLHLQYVKFIILTLSFVSCFIAPPSYPYTYANTLLLLSLRIRAIVECISRVFLRFYNAISSLNTWSTSFDDFCWWKMKIIGFAFNPSPFPSKYIYIYTPQMDLHIIFIYKITY